MTGTGLGRNSAAVEAKQRADILDDYLARMKAQKGIVGTHSLGKRFARE